MKQKNRKRLKRTSCDGSSISMVQSEKGGGQLDTNSGSAKLRPRARLISLIGDELISDEPVALVELVKNAYDADAKKVTVSFSGNDPWRPDTIIVEDDGHGMDLDTVLHSWFEPGTVTKRNQDRSPEGRLYQGAKGIGRFAAARLAEVLFLESKKPGAPTGVFVRLDWGRFDDDSYLDEISIGYEVRPIPDLSKGTRLTLKGIRKAWSAEEYEELYTRLSRLISPFEEVIDFQIELDVPGHPELSGVVQPPELILSPRYLLRGALDNDGRFSGSITVDGDLYRLYQAHPLGERGKQPLCGPFQVEIRAWDRDREGLEPLMQRLNMGIQEIRRNLNAFCGVSIYRDGFRVYPYGQKGNDWLNLDLRSRLTPGENLANNQIVAAIRISREENPGLRDRSTREGMVVNAEHSALEKWFLEILKLLEKARYEKRPRREALDKVEPLFEAFDMHAAVEKALNELGSAHPVSLLLVDTQKQVKEGVDRLQEVFSRLLMSAGLGHMVDIVIHEIGAPLGKVNRQLAVLEKTLAECLQVQCKDRVQTMVDSMKAWLEQIHNLRQRLDPQTPAKRGRVQAFDVLEEIQDNFNLYEALIAKQRIDCELVSTVDGPFKVRMNRAVLGQILANLIDNSTFWLAKTKGTGSGGHVRVTLAPLDHGFRLLFEDDGPGVAEADQTRIFEPYFTTKPNGMGLGLYIARLLIEPYGKLVYRDDSDLGGATFEAIFEKGVGL